MLCAGHLILHICSLFCQQHLENNNAVTITTLHWYGNNGDKVQKAAIHRTQVFTSRRLFCQSSPRVKPVKEQQRGGTDSWDWRAATIRSAAGLAEGLEARGHPFDASGPDHTLPLPQGPQDVWQGRRTDGGLSACEGAQCVCPCVCADFIRECVSRRKVWAQLAWVTQWFRLSVNVMRHFGMITTLHYNITDTDVSLPAIQLELTVDTKICSRNYNLCCLWKRWDVSSQYRKENNTPL